MYTTQGGACSLDSESAIHCHKQATLVAPTDPSPRLRGGAYSDSTFASREHSSGRSMGDQCVQQAPLQLRADHDHGGLGILTDGVNENTQLENTHFQQLIDAPCVPTSHPPADTECASGNCDSGSARLTTSREDNAAPSPRKLFSNVMNTTTPQILGNGGPTQVNINVGSGSLNTVGKNQGNVSAELLARPGSNETLFAHIPHAGVLSAADQRQAPGHSSNVYHPHVGSLGGATTTAPTPPLKDAPSGKHNGCCGSGNNGPNYPHEPRPVQGPLFSTHHVDLVIVLVFVLLLVLAFLKFIARLVDASFEC